MRQTITSAAGYFGRATPYFRGKQTLLEALCPPRGTVEANVFGARMSLDLADAIQRRVFLGYYESPELRLLKRYLPPRGTFVDVGANVGVFTALASRIVGPQGRVISIEPTPALLSRLRASFGSHHPQVTILPVAAGARRGTVHLFIPPASAGNLDPSVVEYGEGMEALEVPMIPLDELLAAQMIDRVDMLKVDVEGFEPEVIEGAASSLKNHRVKAILIELNEPLLRARGHASSAVERQLASFGFEERIAIRTSHDYRNVLFVERERPAFRGPR